MGDKMSKARKSKEIQEEYGKVCVAIGQADFNEREAQRSLKTLRERQVELNREFIAAVGKEQEFAAQEAKAQENTKAFEAKTQDAPSEEAV